MHPRFRDRPTSDSPKGTSPPLVSQLPGPRRILGWIYIGRLLLAGALVLRSSALPDDPDLTRLSSLLVLPVVTLVTAVSFWYSHGRDRAPSEGFLYAQLIFDVLLVTAAVHLTGGEESGFTALYILLISAAALLLPPVGGVLIGVLSGALYLVGNIWSNGGVLGGVGLLHITLFAVVALVTGYLGERLRAAGAALGEVQTELAQLRLDTGDILNTISTGVLTVDEDGRLAYLNPAAEEILSLPTGQWVGQPILERLDRIAPGLGGVIARSARERIAVRRFETEPVNDGAFVLGVSTTLVERSSDQRPVVTAIFQNITEKKRVEALRRRAERLEAIAELSASLAHEIKNPLASIRSAVEQIADGAVDEEDSRVLKSLAVRESDRLSRLLAEFLDFARVKVIAPQPVSFAALVQGVVDLVRAHPDARDRTIQLAVQGDPEQHTIRGAEDLLHRAVLNLVLNGVQWAGPGGRVHLTLEQVESDLLAPARGVASLVRLTIADSGPGVPEEILEHIFDPFFTRRPGGTGLGLALVQRAMEAHGGAVFVDNAPAQSGFGARFTLFLPAVAPDEPVPTPHPQTEEASSP